MTERFDVIVVGGGPAGSTAAGFLNRMGHKVLLLERETFPRHHIGESMIAATIDILAEIGLEEKLKEADFPVKSGGCFMWGRSTDPWCIRFEEIPGRPTSYQVKRSVFDKILLDHAAESGVDVRQEHRVTDVVHEDGRVVGVRFTDGEGREHHATAAYTVDASGLAAVVANRMSKRVPVEELKNMCLYGYWTGEHPAPAKLGGDIRPNDRNNILIKMLADGWLWFIPLGNPGPAGGHDPGRPEISVGFVGPRKNLPESGGRAALEEFYRAHVDSCPEWRYLLQSATYTGEFHTVKDWSYRSENMAGPGYFAVGDASCFVDPILSSGVFLGVLYAKLCAIGVNTILTTAAPEALIHEWYEGLYTDTYSDYLEMARYWYHGHRDVGMWMDRAQEQLGEEEETVFAETSRDAFIALATGNTHAHPNYVPVRRLDSFPLPLHLRKDPRAHYFKEVKTVLLRHSDTAAAPDVADDAERSAQALAKRPEVRRRALSLLQNQQDRLVERFTGHSADTDHQPLVVSAKARVSLEAIADAVRLIVRAPNGERRAVQWNGEHDVLAAHAKPTAPGDVADAATAAFRQELVAAGVLEAVDASTKAQTAASS